MINILIRTSGRPKNFARCLESVKGQTYKKYRVIVCYDGEDYIPEGVEKFKAESNGHGFFWNLYCNELKHRVADGWFFFLDDDDILADETALERIAAHLKGNNNVICQFERFDKVRPSGAYFDQRLIERGEIGMPCFFVHHTNKDLVNFDNQPAADYRYIKSLSEKVQFDWVKEIVVKVFKQGEGKRHDILFCSI